MSFLNSLPSKGKKLSNVTLNRLLRLCILLAYKAKKLSVREWQVTPSTAQLPKNADFNANGLLMEDLCKAAPWAFHIHWHCKIDILASADATFGHRVLQQVLWLEWDFIPTLFRNCFCKSFDKITSPSEWNKEYYSYCEGSFSLKEWRASYLIVYEDPPPPVWLLYIFSFFL